MKIETDIKKVLKVDVDQAVNNVHDFLESMKAMGIILVDENDIIDNAETFSDDFIVDQYICTFN